jgi:quinoprotein glucose dehydrogenase
LKNPSVQKIVFVQIVFVLSLSSVLFFGSCTNQGIHAGHGDAAGNVDYPVYGGNKAGNRYSPLTQINTGNVGDLQVAWSYDAREKEDLEASGGHRVREIQCQPIVVHGILYGTTSKLSVFALNAGTGEQLWKFEPIKDNQKFNTNRGVTYWENGDDRRILYTSGTTLYALDANTGKPEPGFGSGGKVDLHEGLGSGLDHDVNNLSVTATSPGVIYKNVLIVGSSVSESGDAAPGHMRGFDVVTGKLLWVFHTIPQPGEFGYDTWPAGAYQKMGAANNWGGLAVDEKRGIVYFGTGSASSDFYGGDRAGKDLFANCILALDAETGKMKWYFQTIHHDLWDRDIPCPPNLATIRHNGKMVDVLVQATKDGLVYVLDRDSGTSLFPIEERPVPTAGLPGEHPWPTQPFPFKPLPLCRQTLSENDLTDISPEAHAFAKARYLQTLQPNSKFIPPSEGGTLAIGYSGGAEWGGNAIDSDGIFYQNANEDAWDLQMIDMATLSKEMASLSPGHLVYMKKCSFCHGMDRKGSGTQFPNLVNIGNKRSATEIATLINTGSGRMPSFSNLPEEDRKALVDFLLDKEKKNTTPAKPVSEHSDPVDTASPDEKKKSDFPYEPKYVSKVWMKFTDQDGYNAMKPPWGTFNAIDLNTGDYLWRVPLGEFPELTKKGIPVTGTQSYGGPVVTAGGLVFIAGTRDEKLRAFDKKTGRVVWEYQLPAGAFATPISYAVDGKQYIVIAAGGAKDGAKPGGWYIAFALK